MESKRVPFFGTSHQPNEQRLPQESTPAQTASPRVLPYASEPTLPSIWPAIAGLLLGVQSGPNTWLVLRSPWVVRASETLQILIAVGAQLMFIAAGSVIVALIEKRTLRGKVMAQLGVVFSTLWLVLGPIILVVYMACQAD